MRSAPALLLAGLLLAALAPQAPGGAAATFRVDVKNFAFAPRNVSIAEGDTVQWHWVNGTHNVVQDGTNTVWCSSRSSGDCFRTFPAQGNFTYRCTFHGGMRGAVYVGQPAAVVTILGPEEGATVQGRFAAWGTASHASGIDAVEAQLGGEAWVLAGGSANWTAQVDSNPLPNGPQQLRVRATPVSGPAGEAARTVVVDNPPVALQVLAPEDGAVAPGALAVAGRAVHPFNPVTQVRWRVDGGPWANLSLAAEGTAAKWQGVLDVTRLAGGAHTFEFQARDGYVFQDSAVVARQVVVLAP